MSNSGQEILPFYVLVDVSWSMTREFGSDPDGGAPQTGIDAVNQIAPEVAAMFDRSPLVHDSVRFGLIDFSGEAEVRIPLCDISALGTIPRLEARTTGTSYANVFRMLRTQIEGDVEQLKADGLKVMRPAVFFLTDGAPTDASAAEWLQAFAELTDRSFRAYPNFIPFGVLEAPKDVLDQLASYKTAGGEAPKSFLASPQVSAAKAIEGMIEILLGSIVGSATAATEGEGGLVLPEPEDDDEDDDGGVWI